MNTYILKKELPDGSLPGRLFSNSIGEKPNSYFGHYQKEFRGAVSEIPDYVIKNNPGWFELAKSCPNMIYILQKELPDAKIGTEFMKEPSGLYYYTFGKAGVYYPEFVENNPEWFIKKEYVYTPLGIYNDDNAHTIPTIPFVCPEFEVVKSDLMKLIEKYFDKIRNHRYINGKVVWFYKSFEDFVNSLNSEK